MSSNYSRHYNRRKDLALLGEESAANHLSLQGYEIVARNWRAGLWGEVDLIAYDPERTLVFVEVKTRVLESGAKNGIHPIGFEAINRSKQRKIMRSAWRFQQLNGFRSVVRFDAIVIIYCPPETAPQIIHVPNAFMQL
jgi:putative endonuclease